MESPEEKSVQNAQIKRQHFRARSNMDDHLPYNLLNKKKSPAKDACSSPRFNCSAQLTEKFELKLAQTQNQVNEILVFNKLVQQNIDTLTENNRELNSQLENLMH